jgi:nephrocystin-3
MIDPRRDSPEELSLGRYLAHERRVHETFAASRRGIYVERAAAIDALDRFATDGGAPGLLVTGASGAGKSALLANWAMRLRRSTPKAFVVEHYCGTSAANRSHVELIRRVAAEICERYRLTEKPPITADALEEEFPQWLARVQDESLHLVIDGLDQLERLEEIERWLPEYMQPRIRIVASARENAVDRFLADRGWTIWNVEPLSTDERSKVVSRYLTDNQVHLGAEHLERVVEAGPTANPLFLRTSLEELRVSGRDSTDVDTIKRYLSARGLPELMDQVLERLEEAFGPSLTADSLAHIWASRDGLTVDEVAALAGAEQSVIETMFESLSLHLIEHDRRRGFFHEQFRDAVRRRYVAAPDTVVAVRRKIADHFAAMPTSMRSVAELPWQLLQVQAWQELCSVVSSPDVIMTLQRSDDVLQLLLYWSELRPHGDFVATLLESIDLNIEPLEDRVRAAECFDCIGAVLSDAGELEPAAALLERGLEIRRKLFPEAHPDLLRSAVNLARLLNRRGDHVEGERLLRLTIASIEAGALTNTRINLDAFEALGVLLFERREFDAALPICRLALEIAESRGDPMIPVAQFQTLMGAVLFGLKQFDGAETYFARAYSLAVQRLGRSHPITIECLNNLGTVLDAKNSFERAEECFREAIAAWERLFGPRSVPVASGLGNLAKVLLGTSRGAEAVEALTRSVEIYRLVLGENHPATATMLGNLAAARRTNGAYDEAEASQRLSVAAFVAAYGDDHRETIQAYLDLALILALQGETDVAIEIYHRHLPRKAHWIGADHPSTLHSISRFREILKSAGRDETGDPLSTLWTTPES